MASGHEYRANRPNTWLLRPLLQSDDSSCQPGAVHTWHIAVTRPLQVFGYFRSGLDLSDVIHRRGHDTARPESPSGRNRIAEIVLQAHQIGRRYHSGRSKKAKGKANPLPKLNAALKRSIYFAPFYTSFLHSALDFEDKNRTFLISLAGLVVSFCAFGLSMAGATQEKAIPTYKLGLMSHPLASCEHFAS
jgi:hypothetical protein